MKAFLISGIGADQRMFDFLQLPATFTTEYIHWETPLENETVSDYACRLFAEKSTTVPFIIIGISFGGIIAVEIAKKFDPAFTVIISSIPLAAQMPKFYQLAGKLGIHKLLPVQVLKWMTVVKQQMTMKSKTNKALIRRITWDGNDQIIKWGLDAILKWSNSDLPQNLFHIHGKSDTVFPISCTSPSHFIQGGHMLTLENPSEVNSILDEILTD